MQDDRSSLTLHLPISELSRRDFLRVAAAAWAAAAMSPAPARAASSSQGSYRGKLCFFSKPLPGMAWRPLAQNVRRAGYDGIDLTVRPGGHVRPDRAAEDLPKAIADIRGEGLDVPMITTGLVSATDPTARPILSTAGKLSIPFYKPGYYKYDLVDVRKELETVGQEFRRLVELGKECGIQVGYHNHTDCVGAAVWDMARILDTLDPKWAGYYFDIRHAVAEGGGGAWKFAANLAAGRLKMVALKDFYWEKTATKGWQTRDCPLGEGMVDWKRYFQLLARSGFHGPISVHLEYKIDGATPAAQQDNVLAAAQRDLEFVKARVREAYV